MKIAGVDISSFAIDIVLVPLDGEGLDWYRFKLVGADAFDRARSVADAVPGRGSVFWDEVLAVGIENPQARGPRAHSIGSLHRVVGAVLACIPARMLVAPLQPSAWRAAVGLPGNASKNDVSAFVRGVALPALTWPQDACDAACIAWATRSQIETERAA